MLLIEKEMEPEPGKLFIGGISWETDEDRLREYFGQYGNLVEVMIMLDWNTRRSRGFGFIVFGDPADAEGLTLQKHMIDGRMVEVKKAVPRVSKNNGTSLGSPSPNRTKKIFVGGLASNTLEGDFKNYFEQFGVITDVVVMHDLNTRKPRGFGFVTYDSEDAVDKVLHETFHELNGKMVEVKRAVPKEQLPGSSTRGHNYVVNQLNGLPNGYGQGYNLNPFGGRFGMLAGAHDGLSLFNNSFGMGMDLESSIQPNLNGNSNITDSLNYLRQLCSYYDGTSKRYSNSIGIGDLNDDAGSLSSLLAQNLSLRGVASENSNWSGPISANGLGSNFIYGRESLGSGMEGNTSGLSSSSYGMSSYADTVGTTFAALSNGYERNNTAAYDTSSMYGDTTSKFSSSEIDLPISLGYCLGNLAPNVRSQISASYSGNYNQNG